MGLLNSSTTITRFRIIDPVEKDFWLDFPVKLKQYAFKDIDDLPEERSFGWTNFDDMLDVDWHTSPPEKGSYLAFSLRLETRRIPAAVLKKHTMIALKDEERKNADLGKKFIPRDRKFEIKEQVKLRLRQRFLPVPAIFEVVWASDKNMIYFASNNEKMIDMLMEYFLLSFNLHLEQLTPYNLAATMLDENRIMQLENLDDVRFA